MAQWDFETIKGKISVLDLWAARMIYRLGMDFRSIDLTGVDPEEARSDEMFFVSLKDYFAENGHFTDRHIALARRKLRDPYVHYLVSVANS